MGLLLETMWLFFIRWQADPVWDKTMESRGVGVEIFMGYGNILNSPQMGSRWDSHNLDLKYEI